MIRLLKAVVLWLESRFPPQVVLSEESFSALVRRIDAIESSTGKLSQMNQSNWERVNSVEKSVVALKEALVKATSPAAVADNRRSNFVASGRMGE